MDASLAKVAAQQHIVDRLKEAAGFLLLINVPVVNIEHLCMLSFSHFSHFDHYFGF
jgi:hypothetical protein